MKKTKDKIRAEESKRLEDRLKGVSLEERTEYISGYNSEGGLFYSDLAKEGYKDVIKYLYKLNK